MLKVDLVTGFLGSGKTTFIQKYLHYLKSRDQKVHIIENEFGAVNADRKILESEDQVSISDLTGVCMCCKGQRMFSNMLLESAAAGNDRCIVEPSGIYDVDEFFETMKQFAIKESCEIGSIITVVDAHFIETLSDESLYLMFSQLLAGGIIVLSKTQLFEYEIEATIEKLNDMMTSRGCSKIAPERIIAKDWNDFTDDDFEKIMNSGYHIEEHDRNYMSHDEVFETKELAQFCKDEEDLKERLHNLFTNHERFGNIIRVKGHIRDFNKKWLEINCTPDVISIRPANIKRGLFIVIGQNMNSDAVKAAFLSKEDLPQ